MLQHKHQNLEINPETTMNSQLIHGYNPKILELCTNRDRHQNLGFQQISRVLMGIKENLITPFTNNSINSIQHKF